MKNILQIVLALEVIDDFEDNQEKYIDFLTQKETDYFIDYISTTEENESDCLNSVSKFELLHLIKEYLLKNDYSFNYEAIGDTKYLNVYKDSVRVNWNKLVDISEYDIFIKALREIIENKKV